MTETPIRFKDYAFETWSKRYGVPAPWGKLHYMQLAKAAKQIGDEDRACRAWDAYLRDSEPFYAGHEPSKFLKTVSTWVSKALPKPGPRTDTDRNARGDRMREIFLEVEHDASIPMDRKRAECDRRWKELQP